MTVLLTTLSLVLAGRLHQERAAPYEVPCPEVGPLTPRATRLIDRAMGRALPADSDVTVALRPCLGLGLPAEASGSQIQLSRVDLDEVLEFYPAGDRGDEDATDYLTFVLAHEAEHLRVPRDDPCPLMEAELEADRAAALRSRRGGSVLGDLLEYKAAAVREALPEDSPQAAGKCINLLELSVRTHALAVHQATGARAHHYYASNEAMHEAVTRQYELVEEVFDLVLKDCEQRLLRHPSTCNERRLDAVKMHRERYDEAPPASWQDWDVAGPWPRYVKSTTAVDVGVSVGTHWIKDAVDEPRARRAGPGVDLLLWRQHRLALERGRAIGFAWGGGVGYRALLGGGDDPIHRMHLAVVVGSSGSLGRLGGGVEVGAGLADDIRVGADEFGALVRGGAHGEVRLRPRLELVVRAHYVALLSLTNRRSNRRISDQYSHGLDVSLAVATYFGRR